MNTQGGQSVSHNINIYVYQIVSILQSTHNT